MKSHQLTPDYVRKLSKRNQSGCWIWKPKSQSTDCGQLRLDGKMISAHRLSWIASNGLIPPGKLVLHKCATPRCVRPDHLFLGTKADCGKHGFVDGHKLSSCKRDRKLTDWAVYEIRSSNEKLAVLAEKFNVSKVTISLVRNGKRKNKYPLGQHDNEHTGRNDQGLCG